MLRFFISALAIAIAISVHEFGHALTSNALGDPTAKYSGRMTLNPIAHMDPVGLIFFALIGFGWANPVPVDSYNFKNRKRDFIIVSAAGGVFNILTAIIFAIAMRFSPGGSVLVTICQYVIRYNIAFAAFNLFIPIPPLDGWNILNQLFNLDRYDFSRYLYSYSIMFIMLLSFTGVLGTILRPAQSMINQLVYSLAYLI